MDAAHLPRLRFFGQWFLFLETRGQGAALVDESYARENGLFATLRDRPSKRVAFTIGGYGQGARGDLGAIVSIDLDLADAPQASHAPRGFFDPRLSRNIRMGPAAIERPIRIYSVCNYAGSAHTSLQEIITTERGPRPVAEHCADTND